MKIEQFIDEFNKSQDKEAYVKKHITKEYIPYSHKISLCNNIAEFTTHKQVQGRKIFSIDTAMRYMLFVLTIIESYTDIELGLDDKRMKAFDLIEQYNVMFFIANCMGNEYKRLDTVLKMQVDDIYSNERDLPSFLDTKIDAINLVLEKMGELNEQKNQQHIESKDENS